MTELLSMALGKPDTNLTQLYRLLLQIPNQTVLAPLSLTLQTDGTVTLNKRDQKSKATNKDEFNLPRSLEER